MDEATYSGSLWSRAAALLALGLAGAAFRTAEFDTINALLATTLYTSLLGFYAVHELLRQSRPVVIVSDLGLRWQPAALWRSEQHLPWEEIARAEPTSFRLLTLTTQKGTSHRIPLLGLRSSDRTAIVDTISERIAT